MTLNEMKQGETGWTDEGREFTVLHKGKTISRVEYADTGKQAVYNSMPVHADTDAHRAGCTHCQYVYDCRLPEEY